ncbi:MAG: hypothetical protein IPJ33_04270 [Gammaproteobacteria bacterium]|nr:hypothetical protein [Gammaproteobacteria bacterium]
MLQPGQRVVAIEDQLLVFLFNRRRGQHALRVFFQLALEFVAGRDLDIAVTDDFLQFRLQGCGQPAVVGGCGLPPSMT